MHLLMGKCPSSIVKVLLKKICQLNFNVFDVGIHPKFGSTINLGFKVLPITTWPTISVLNANNDNAPKLTCGMKMKMSMSKLI